MDIAKFQHNIWELLRSLSQGMASTFRAIAESHGLTMAQMRILMELRHHGQCTVGELSMAIDSAPGNTSAMCKALEKKGLLTRQRDQDDERIVRIALTHEGSSILTQINKELSIKCDPVLKEFSSEDYEQILTGMSKLKDVIDSLHTMIDAD